MFVMVELLHIRMGTSGGGSGMPDTCFFGNRNKNYLKKK
jgi:hypothetical protein